MMKTRKMTMRKKVTGLVVAHFAMVPFAVFFPLQKRAHEMDFVKPHDDKPEEG